MAKKGLTSSAQKNPWPPCLSCKVKHRGCDKKLPRCSACIRYGFKCTYPQTTGIASGNAFSSSALINKPKHKPRNESEEYYPSASSYNPVSNASKLSLAESQKKHTSSRPLGRQNTNHATEMSRALPIQIKQEDGGMEDGHFSPPSPSCFSFVIEEMKGSPPRLKSHFTRSVSTDSASNRTTMYVFGGTKGDKPSSDFHTLDMISGEWTDLTNTLIRLDDPSIKLTNDPFGRKKMLAPRTPLPPRADATSQIYEPRTGGSFLLIFGGNKYTPQMADNGASTNTLIKVDLSGSNLTWEFVPTKVDDWTQKKKTTEVTARSAAGSFIHDDKLFVFGGYCTVKQGGTNIWGWETVDSFSILCLERLVWIACDRPFPPHVGSLGYYLDVYIPPCYEGRKVLICRSKLDDDKAITLTPSDMFIFNTSSFTFSSLSQVEGQAPPPLVVYDIAPYRGPATESTFLLFGLHYDDQSSSGIWSFDIRTDSWMNLGLGKELKQLRIHWLSLEHVPSKGWCLFGYQRPEQEMIATGDTGQKKVEQERPKIRKTWNVCVRIKLDDDMALAMEWVTEWPKVF